MCPPVKASQPGEVGSISCFACWLHPLTSGNCTSFCFEKPSSVHCRQCCRGSGNINQGGLPSIGQVLACDYVLTNQILSCKFSSWTVRCSSGKPTEDLIPSASSSQSRPSISSCSLGPSWCPDHSETDSSDSVSGPTYPFY